jgi:hypothetical protein
MATPPLSWAKAQETVDALDAHGGVANRAAASLGVHPETFRHRLRTAARYGILPASIPKHARPPEGFVVKEHTVRVDQRGNISGQTIRNTREPGDVFAPLPGHIIKGESAFVDPEGNVVAKWVKTREGERDPLDIARQLKLAFKGWKLKAPQSTAPAACDASGLTLYPFGDWHIGMFAWGRETGENWDLKIAESTIGDAACDLIAASPRSAEAIILGGGDLLHADNAENRTARSGHTLDVDGRYAKVVQVAGRLKVRTIDAALARHGQVTVRILPGNHDEHTSLAIGHFLLAWYRAEPRVTVDLSPGLFFWRRFGKVMLGATHGHTVKVQDMPSIMAHRRAEDWGATAHRYVHGFHLHHKKMFATEGGGVICEVHQAPVPQDAWHHGAGFLSGRSLQSITYDADLGERSRTRLAIMPRGEIS